MERRILNGIALVALTSLTSQATAETCAPAKNEAAKLTWAKLPGASGYVVELSHHRDMRDSAWLYTQDNSLTTPLGSGPHFYRVQALTKSGSKPVDQAFGCIDVSTPAAPAIKTAHEPKQAPLAEITPRSEPAIIPEPEFVSPLHSVGPVISTKAGFGAVTREFTVEGVRKQDKGLRTPFDLNLDYHISRAVVAGINLGTDSNGKGDPRSQHYALRASHTTIDEEELVVRAGITVAKTTIPIPKLATPTTLSVEASPYTLILLTIDAATEISNTDFLSFNFAVNAAALSSKETVLAARFASFDGSYHHFFAPKNLTADLSIGAETKLLKFQDKSTTREGTNTMRTLPSMGVGVTYYPR